MPFFLGKIMKFLDLSAAIDVLTNSAIATFNNARKITNREDFIRHNLEAGRAAFEDLAIIAAFESLGIEFELGEKINESTVTQAINKTLLSGTDFELVNVFDIEGTKQQIEAYALKKINEGLGGELILKSLRKPDLKRAIKSYGNSIVQAELAAGGGAISDALGDDEAILAIIATYEESRDKPASDNPKAEGNRSRQATYRANHHRQWES